MVRRASLVFVACLVACADSPGDGGEGGVGGAPAGSIFACTEAGVQAAIAEGGGPHTFDCDGPTTVLTEAEIRIDFTSVILDGEGKLTLDADRQHSVLSVGSDGQAELRGMTLKGGSGFSAGMYFGAGISNSGLLTLVDSHVTGNHVQNSGGGIANDGETTLIGTRVSGNTAGGAGGGIFNRGVLTLIESRVSGNSAPHATGGGIDNSGTLTLLSSAVTGNSSGFGGGIRNRGMLTLVNSTVSVNTATPAPLAATAGGGGIANAGTSTLVNSTVAGNAATEGGGIWNGIGTLTLSNSTVANNAAGYGSGISAYTEGTVTLIHTLIDNACEGGTPTSGGGNIESPGDTCSFDQASDLVNVSADDLKLGPLQDNGGPTETHALGADSVAIDVIPEAECVDAEGEPLTTDQRDLPRDSMCDVGAFEVQQ